MKQLARRVICMGATVTILGRMSLPVAGQSRIPDAFLEIAVHQREDGKLGRGLHRLQLSCFGGECSLTITTLNQCVDVGLGTGPVFIPKVERWGTRERTLAVQNAGRTLLVQQATSDFGGNSSVNYRFEYAPIVPRVGAAVELVSFSGAFVKDSTILGGVITVEYVPLPKDFQAVRLDCDVWLPGVQTTPK